jgi:hypothetical protein
MPPPRCSHPRTCAKGQHRRHQTPCSLLRCCQDAVGVSLHAWRSLAAAGLGHASAVANLDRFQVHRYHNGRCLGVRRDMCSVHLHGQSQAAEAVAVARRELVAVFEAMPRDLQQTMLSAPRRADLLHSLGAHTKVHQQPQLAVAHCSADRCTADRCAAGRHTYATFPHCLRAHEHVLSSCDRSCANLLMCRHVARYSGGHARAHRKAVAGREVLPHQCAGKHMRAGPYQ